MTSPFKLYGILAINGNSEYDVCFNKEALERFCYNNRDKGYLYPFGGFNLGIEPLEAKETQTEQPQQELEEEITQGIRVKDIQKIFDRNHPRYRNSIELAIRAWLSFEDEPKPDNVTVKNEIEGRMTDLINEKEYLRVSGKERERLKIIVNWDKDGNKFA